MYASTFVRYERNGDRVTPLCVTKQWVSWEVPNRDSRKEPVVRQKFITTRVTRLPQRFVPGVGWTEDGEPVEMPPWQSSAERVESRERLMTLLAKDGEPALQEAGYDQRWLPLGDLSRLTAAQAAQTLETQWGGE